MCLSGPMDGGAPSGTQHGRLCSRWSSRRLPGSSVAPRVSREGPSPMGPWGPHAVGNIFYCPPPWVINTTKHYYSATGPRRIDSGWMSSQRVTMRNVVSFKVIKPPPCLPSVASSLSKGPALCSCFLPKPTLHPRWHSYQFVI